MPFPTCGIPGIPDLMHHKYVVRDGESVWTGSMNWTTDSWTLQENVSLVAEQAPALAAEFSPQLRRALDRARRGRERAPGPAAARRGRPPDARMVHARATARSSRTGSPRRSARRRERVRIASPVITAGPVLGTLAEVAAERRVDLRGVVDRTQMDQVVYQWRTNGHSAWKIPILASVLAQRGLQGKAVDSVDAGDAPRLHAREGHRGGRHRLRRVVQPVALRRDERRERARGARRRARRPASPPSSTRSASATSLCPCLPVSRRHEQVAHLGRVVREREQLQVVRARSSPRRACARASQSTSPRQ